jgi:hypothetical protein
MKTLTFITNLVNHHQLPLADEFYKILGEGYSYIATEPLPDWLIEGGYDSSLDRPYIIRAYENKNSFNKAKFLANTSDVVIMGEASVRWIRKNNIRESTVSPLFTRSPFGIAQSHGCFRRGYRYRVTNQIHW